MLLYGNDWHVKKNGSVKGKFENSKLGVGQAKLFGKMMAGGWIETNLI